MTDAAALVDPERICADTFIRHVELHDLLPSTSNRAIGLAGAADLKMPVLVLARRQTAGRGRGSNRWWSADGALTFSLLLEGAELGITSRDWPRVSLTTAVAVCDALPVRGLIKWPNDVLVDGHKICGILIESPGGSAPAKDRFVIGVGINVNNTWREVPEGAGMTGIALCDATGRQHGLQRVLIRFLRALEKRLEQLAGGDPQLPSTWQALCWLRERHVEVDVGGRRVEGRCSGIADDGALVVQTNSNTEHVYSGSVRSSGQ